MESSLKELRYESAEPDALLEMALRKHADTLEVVSLLRMKSPCTLPVALLDACPRLRTLECPLLVDVTPESFSGLETLILTISRRNEIQAHLRPDLPPFEPVVERSAALLRKASQYLTNLGLRCSGGKSEGYDNSQLRVLLQAVAASGMSSVRYLHVTPEFRSNFWPTVTAVVPRLPRVEHLDLCFTEAKANQLWKITPRTAPNLKQMSFGVQSCLHCWVHRHAVTAFFRRNSGVLAYVINNSPSETRSVPCTRCADRPCHKELRRDGKLVCVATFHSPALEGKPRLLGNCQQLHPLVPV